MDPPKSADAEAGKLAGDHSAKRGPVTDTEEVCQLLCAPELFDSGTVFAASNRNLVDEAIIPLGVEADCGADSNICVRGPRSLISSRGGTIPRHLPQYCRED